MTQEEAAYPGLVEWRALRRRLLKLAMYFTPESRKVTMGDSVALLELRECNSELARRECPLRIPESTLSAYVRANRLIFTRRRARDIGASATRQIYEIQVWLDSRPPSPPAQTITPGDRRRGLSKRSSGWVKAATAIGVLSGIVTLTLALPTIPPIRAWILIGEAGELEDAGERDLAEERAREANAAQPHWPYIERRVGYIFFRNQHWEQGVRYICRSLRGDPTDLNALVELGIAYVTHHQPDLARPLFETASNLYPDNAYELRNHAVYETISGNFEQTESLSRRALALKPEAIAWGNLASALQLQGKWSELQDLLERPLAPGVTPDDAAWWRTQLRVGAGEFKEVQRDYPDEWPDLLAWASRRAFVAGRYDTVARISDYFVATDTEPPEDFVVTAVATSRKRPFVNLERWSAPPSQYEWIDAMVTQPTIALPIGIKNKDVVRKGLLPSCAEVSVDEERFTVPTPRPSR